MSGRSSSNDTQADIDLRKCLQKRQSFKMIAGAGSGKTTSLIKALIHIKTEYGLELQSKGQQVACITYTKVAENEIKTDTGDDDLFHVSTIHSFLWSVIKSFQKDIFKWVEQKINEDINDLREKNSRPRTHNTTSEKNKLKILQYETTLKNLKHIKHNFDYGLNKSYDQGILGHSDIISMVPELILNRPLLCKIVAQKYPFIFVDESQDTDKKVLEALLAIDKASTDHFCLGFFGDPMQQIFATGVGEIPKEANLELITKEENFRSPTEVLHVINQIRQETDGLIQKGGLKEKVNGEERSVKGSARLFIMEANDNRNKAVDCVQDWLAKENNDPCWHNKSGTQNIKKLVLLHRMVAIRLGFVKLFDAIKNGPDSYSTDLIEGTLWMITPFQQFLIPIINAYNNKNQYEIIRLLIAKQTMAQNKCASPRMSQDKLKQSIDINKYLSEINKDIATLATMMSPDNNEKHTINDCLKYIFNKELFTLDDRLIEAINETLTDLSIRSDSSEDEQSIQKKFVAIEAYLQCPAIELWEYIKYIGIDSPYSTQHSIKGAQFKRVLIILDDEEGRAFSLYSFNKLFGLVSLSLTDQENINNNRDSVLDRTRRLFYVCCSRAQKDLAVILFVKNVQEAKKQINSSYFKPDSILTLDELQF